MLVMTTSALLCSCASVVHVKEGAKEISGIPFYVKNEYFRQVTVYRETWFQLTLKAEKKLVDVKDGQEVLLDRGAQSFTASVTNLNDPTVVGIKAAILGADSSTVSDALVVIQKFQSLPSSPTGVNKTILKNEIESQWLVDDDRPFYLNAPLPWFGTATLTQKLSADGTLTEVTATADTKLAESISTLLPLKEFLSGKYVKAAAAASTDSSTKADFAKGISLFAARGGNVKPTDKQFVYILSLTTEEIGYETTLKTDPKNSRAGISGHIPIDSTTASISRKPIQSAEEKPKDDSPTIGISGSIKLPKEK
jgi:hypothetical protein